MSASIRTISKLLLDATKMQLGQFWRGVINGFGTARAPRYSKAAFLGLAGIWSVTLAYLIFTPRIYESEFTLILPGAGAGASVNLNSIGQASSLSESAFSSPRLNPTESYKRLILGDRVIEAASRIAKTEDFPKPTVTLLDQTQFMEVSVRAWTPETAKTFADALETAFLSEVDKLRGEERRAREAGYQLMISEFESAVSTARAALLSHQSESGLASLEQFNENVAMVSNIETELNTSRIAEAAAQRHLETLISTLGISSNEAAIALAFTADPVFLALADTLAASETHLAEMAQKFGNNHPKIIMLEIERSGVITELVNRGRVAGSHSDALSLATARRLSGEEYSALMRAIVDANADVEGARLRSSKLEELLEGERMKIKTLSAEAAKLDDLNRAHQVAEAVFRSSMARIDTNKTDLFASYPLVQTVESPSLPDQPASPIPTLGMVGAIAASILYIIGLILLCIRLPLLRVLARNA